MPPRSEKAPPPSPDLSASPAASPAAGSEQTPAPKSFEKGLEELEAIVQELERGELTLEESIVLFEKGMALSNTCREQLADAETRVEILLRKGGKMTPEPFPGLTSEENRPRGAALPPSGSANDTDNDDDLPF